MNENELAIVASRVGLWPEGQLVHVVATSIQRVGLTPQQVGFEIPPELQSAWDFVFDDLLRGKLSETGIQDLCDLGAVGFFIKLLKTEYAAIPDGQAKALAGYFAPVSQRKPVELRRAIHGFAGMLDTAKEIEQAGGSFADFVKTPAGWKFCVAFIQTWWAYGAMAYVSIACEEKPGLISELDEGSRMALGEFFFARYESASELITAELMRVEDVERESGVEAVSDADERVHAVKTWIQKTCRVPHFDA